FARAGCSAVTRFSGYSSVMSPGIFPPRLGFAAPAQRAWLPYMAAILAVVAIPFLFSQTTIRTFNQVLLMALTAQGLALVMGFGGLVSVATAALLGVGGFLAGYLYEGF